MRTGKDIIELPGKLTVTREGDDRYSVGFREIDGGHMALGFFVSIPENVLKEFEKEIVS